MRQVVSRTDASRGAAARFAFWAPPVVSSISMDELGLQLVVKFDHATNRASMGATDQACSLHPQPSTLHPKL